jgi:hypothetical protein
VRAPSLTLPFLALGATLLALVAACGAENAEAPPAEIKQADTLQCRGFDQLMPNFLSALKTGRTENLRVVIENGLLATDRPGDPPPINEVLRAVFSTLSTFANAPPEAGAPAGLLCADPPPPLAQANGLCELRRSTQVLIHEGKGLEAVLLAQPQLTAVLDYVIGKGSDGKPHYEIADIFTGLCAQDANCQLDDGLELIAALAQYANSADGKAAIGRLVTLAASGTITNFLDPNNLTEDGAVAIARALLTAVQGADPTALDNLPLPASVKGELSPVLADFKKLLDPNYRPNVVGPLKKSLNCFTRKDSNLDTIRMIYRLALRDKRPEFGLTRLTQLISGLQNVDTRGSLLFVVQLLAQALKSDSIAIDSAASVCRAVTSTRPAPGQARTNAQLALPVLSELLAQGVLDEALCALDTLVWGCSGGAQPACQR